MPAMNEFRHNPRDSREEGGPRELWAAVMQDGVDRSQKIIKIKKNPTKKQLEAAQKLLRDRDDARRFVTEEDGMFDVICNILGIDPMAARERVCAKWEDEQCQQ